MMIINYEDEKVLKKHLGGWIKENVTIMTKWHIQKHGL